MPLLTRVLNAANLQVVLIVRKVEICGEACPLVMEIEPSIAISQGGVKCIRGQVRPVLEKYGMDKIEASDQCWKPRGGRDMALKLIVQW